ncbi:DNA-binding transcriptional LysR family regulator [Sphingobium sp. OAS761]|nr:DNA-binding transcriptional LysR family regulator [Sphingobium sp. OAS761]
MLDRYLLRYFLAVVDQGNFSRAAAHCTMSQPMLSVGIARLERTLGMALFVRSNQRVELTGGGTRFLAHARRIEREFNLAMQSMGMADSLRWSSSVDCLLVVYVRRLAAATHSGDQR